MTWDRAPTFDKQRGCPGWLGQSQINDLEPQQLEWLLEESINPFEDVAGAQKSAYLFVQPVSSCLFKDHALQKQVHIILRVWLAGSDNLELRSLDSFSSQIGLVSDQTRPNSSKRKVSMRQLTELPDNVPWCGCGSKYPWKRWLIDMFGRESCSFDVYPGHRVLFNSHGQLCILFASTVCSKDVKPSSNLNPLLIHLRQPWLHKALARSEAPRVAHVVTAVACARVFCIPHGGSGSGCSPMEMLL